MQHKLKIAIITFVLALLFTVFYFTKKNPENDFSYFTYLCKIYNRNGHIVDQRNNWIFCDFLSDGKLLATNPYKGQVSLFDKNNTVLWTSDEYIHHDLKFTPDKLYWVGLLSEIIKNKKNEYRSDCAIKRDLMNNHIGRWCVSEHLTELSALGFKLTPTFVINTFLGQKFTHEITHANSIYEIPDNPSSSKNPAFSKGNYIINFYGDSHLVVILDKNLEKILWYQDASNLTLDGKTYKTDLHDVQVLENGHILLFANRMYLKTKPRLDKVFMSNFQINLGLLYFYKPYREQLFSALIEYDPIDDKIIWMYTDDPKDSFYSETNGTVTKLENSVFYSYLHKVAGGGIKQVNFTGLKLWSFIPPEKTPKKMSPIAAVGAKPFFNTEYLKARGLSD